LARGGGSRQKIISAIFRGRYVARRPNPVVLRRGKGKQLAIKSLAHAGGSGFCPVRPTLAFFDLRSLGSVAKNSSPMSPEINLPAGPHVAGGEFAAASSETSFLFSGRTYRAFISYSHADSQWAKWLVRRLENFKVPERFHGLKAPIGKVGAQIAPVFRDRDELPTTSDLGETIRSALRQSATLIVICSPTSAKSRWVHEEILTFKRLGGSPRVFAFIVGGEPKAQGAEQDCFSPALRAELGPDGELSQKPAEVVAADARPQGDGKEDAFVRLVSGLLGVGFDELRQRELQRRHRRLTWIATGSAFGMAITLGLAAVAWRARNDAQRRQEQAEDLLGFMVGDLRTELKKVGQLKLLDAVGDKASAYFAALAPRDLTDTALARQAKAFTQIGDNRVEEARYPEAVRAYTAAYERAAALAARHPENGEMLFERAQAEFGLGALQRKTGDQSAAFKWMMRYRDSTAVLAALDPRNLKWREEQASGLHNLAVLQLDRGELDAARTSFTSKLEAQRAMVALAPENLDLLYSMADTESWLGSVAERRGDLPEAAQRFANKAAGLAAISARDPKTMRWKYEWANALSLHSGVLAITGKRDEAKQRLADARALMAELTARDAANREWLITAQRMQLRAAALLAAEGGVSEAARLAGAVRAALDQGAGALAANRSARVQLVMALRMEAELAADSAVAARTIERAIEMGDALVRPGTPSDAALTECALAYVAFAQLLTSRGEVDAGRRAAQHALEVLAPRWEKSNDWRFLDPATRAVALLGRQSEAAVLASRLSLLGYQPLVPWPGSLSVSPSSTTKS
jgi:hypothetical protein